MGSSFEHPKQMFKLVHNFIDNFTPMIFVFTWPSNFISAEVEETMKYDRLLSAHYKYFVREMRIVAYNQLLESYSSLTLEYMANAFGVTIHFIDQ